MNQQRGWSFIGLFIIALVVSLPFYSANALAVSLQITKNQGQAGLPRFIDAQSDVWTVEATITGADSQTINPTDVKLKIGNNEAPFQSCSAAPFGVACEYISPLTDGVAEGEFAFQVLYNFLSPLGLPDSVSNADVIKADGSGPVITGLTTQQNNLGKVLIDFTVNDRVNTNVPAVGIRKIDIMDADTGNVLQTIVIGQPDVLQWDYQDDGDFNGQLQTTLTGEGFRRIKVRAEDRLGHQSQVDPIVQFLTDFVPPTIQDQINFTDFGRFIGQFTATTTILADIQESNLEEVRATSAQTSLDNTAASDCVEDEETEGLWHCRWNDVEVNPDAAVSVTITAKDQAGNEATRTLSQTFTIDVSPPTVEFLGTERQFEDKNFIRSGKQRIVLRISESGAGLSPDGIRANLQELGKSQSEPPTSCEQTESTFNCYWDTTKSFSSDGAIRIGLSRFQDNVGNEGEMPQVELFVDTSGAEVDKLELFGVSEIGEKDYFQSNDRLKIKFKAFESTGLYVLVDLNKVVNDAETLFPMDYVAPGIPEDAGWKVFTDADGCQREENGRWACELETDSLRSGPDDVKVELRIQDTAGNDVPVANWPDTAKNVDLTTAAKQATLRFELKGLLEENNPDYWEVAFGYPKPQPLLNFVDLDTTELTYTRMPLTIKLRSETPQAKVVNMDITECTPTVEGESAAPAPALSRTILYGGSYPEGHSNPPATLILEFTPFNGRELFAISADTATAGQFQQATAKYTCRLNVYSIVGSNAIRAAEIQEVQVEVPFAFSVNGAIDENLANRIRNLQDKWWVELADALSIVDTILKWLRYISNIFQIIVTVNQIMDIVSVKTIATATNAEKTPVGQGVGAALRGTCGVLQATQKPSWEFVRAIQPFVDILTCNPAPEGANILSWYGKWQKAVLDAYNIASLRGPAGLGATSLYENIYTSIAGLCVPGMLYNLNKARELHCRRVFCYAREVPQGIATIDACDKLYDLQMCEFFFGPALDILPPFGLIGQIGSMIRNALSSPLGLISLTEVIGCLPLCFDPTDLGGKLTACKVVTVFNKVLDIIESILSAIDNRPDLQGSPYCDLVDDIDLDELVGQQGQRQSQVPSSPVQPVTESAAPVQPTTG